MFTAADISDRLGRQPFEPVRFVTSSGEQFDVYHPELVMVGRRYVVIGTPNNGDPRTFEHLTQVPMLHITALHDLAVPEDSGTDGDGQR